jgi:bifunctional DNA-binding transcriptional regulator/antitoxin component of YhaV-PrlF toxin-antitoxin module
MTKVININGRGTLTLPKELRQRAGIKTGGQIVAQATDKGILLRAGTTFPVEVYSDKRLTEFARNNEAALAGFRLKK